MANQIGTPNPGSNASQASGVGQTNLGGRATSMTSSAAKVFREFKWGLLTLFLLMVVVIGLMYDGGRNKKKAAEGQTATHPELNTSGLTDVPIPPTSPDSSSPSGDGQHLTGDTYNAPIPAPPDFAPPAPGPTADNQPRRGTTPVPPGRIETHPAMPHPTDVAAAKERTYTVKAGDTLTRIASEMLPGKGGIKAILDANKDTLSDANTLHIGMVLKVPAALHAAAPGKTGPGVSEKKTESAKAEPAVPAEYVVKAGDSLEQIARKLFNDGRKWRDLYEWNRDQLADPGHLRVGQSLKLKPATTPTAAPSSVRAEIVEPDSDVRASEPVHASIRATSNVSAANVP